MSVLKNLFFGSLLFSSITCFASPYNEHVSAKVTRVGVADYYIAGDPQSALGTVFFEKTSGSTEFKTQGNGVCPSGAFYFKNNTDHGKMMMSILLYAKVMLSRKNGQSTMHI